MTKKILKYCKNILFTLLSLTFALIISTAILIGISYKLYTDYHMRYIAIEQNWTNVTNSFDKDLAEYQVALELIKKEHIENIELKNAEDLLMATKQGLKYIEKYKNYKSLVLKNKELNNILNVDVSIKDNLIEINKFNNTVTNWNKRNYNIIFKYIDEILMYKEWHTLKISQ